MGEGEIQTASVKVKAVTEEVERHDHALGVPTGTSRPPRRRPRRLIGLGFLPQHEVER
jgi:hypothetical protein